MKKKSIPIILCATGLFIGSCGLFPRPNELKVPSHKTTTITAASWSSKVETKVPEVRKTIRANNDIPLIGKILVSVSDEIFQFDVESQSKKVLVSNEFINDYPVFTSEGVIYFLSDQGAMKGILEVYRLNISTRKILRITEDDYFDYYLTSCSKQDFVAFVSDRYEESRNYNIYLSGYGGIEKPIQVYTNKKAILGLQCSIDGEKLYYLLSEDNIKGDLFEFDIRGKVEKKLTKSNSVSSFSLSTNGDKVAFVNTFNNTDELIVSTLEDETKVILAYSNFGHHLARPVFSHSADYVVVEEFLGDKQSLVILNVSGENVNKVTTPENGSFTGVGYHAAWSPDDNFVAYQLIGDNNTGSLHIYSVTMGRTIWKSDVDYPIISSLFWY